MMTPVLVSLTGPRTHGFFAPDRRRKRIAGWGRESMDQRFAAAWQRFAPPKDWVDAVTARAPEALHPRCGWMSWPGAAHPGRSRGDALTSLSKRWAS